MEGPRVVLLVLLLFFLFLSPDTQQASPSQRVELGKRISRFQDALDSLRNSTYGHLTLNDTEPSNSSELQGSEGLDWSLLPEVQDIARTQLLDFHQLSGQSDQDSSGLESQDAYEHAIQQELPLYQNVSGKVRGKFSSRLVSRKPRPLNLTALVPSNDYVTHEFTRNVTESEGEISVRLVDKEDQQADSARDISAYVTIYTDSSPGSGWEMKLYGTRFLNSGLIILTTTSEKFTGVFNLPQFALSKADFDSSTAQLNRSLSDTLKRWDVENDPLIPWSSSPSDAGATLFPVPSCEYIIYLQQSPVRFPDWKLDLVQTKEMISQVEKELRYPDGAPIPQPPPLSFSAVAFSPDCGFILESQSENSHLSGPKTETFWTLIRRLLLAVIITLGMQLALLKRQMDDASTPSTRSRISYQSIAIMAMGDGLSLAGFIAFVMIDESAFLMVCAGAFFSCLNVAFFEMKFIYDIWTVQVGDQLDRQRARDQRQGATTQPPATAPPLNMLASTGLPLPVTAPRPAERQADVQDIPIIIPPDQDIDVAIAEDDRAEPRQTATANAITPAPRNARAEFSALYSRFYFSMLFLIFLSLWAFSWPRALRSGYVNLLSFAYLSFWIPQIYRNVMRNCRQALRWEYVVGISLLRLVPITYCYTSENNVLSMSTDYTGGAFLIGWVVLQLLALASQQFLGPRLFVKESWCPPAYDYHPILREDGDEEAGALLPIGFVASASEAKDKEDGSKEKDKKDSRKVFDCAICMNEIDVPVVSKSEGAEGSGLGITWLGRRNYMVTPCRHIFHTECLEGWMRLRLVCPICREGLPPL